MFFLCFLSFTNLILEHYSYRRTVELIVVNLPKMIVFFWLTNFYFYYSQAKKNWKDKHFHCFFKSCWSNQLFLRYNFRSKLKCLLKTLRVYQTLSISQPVILNGIFSWILSQRNYLVLLSKLSNALKMLLMEIMSWFVACLIF